MQEVIISPCGKNDWRSVKQIDEGEKSESLFMIAVGNQLQLINEDIFQLLLRMYSPATLTCGCFAEELRTGALGRGIPLRGIADAFGVFLPVGQPGGNISAAVGPVDNMGIIDKAAVQQDREELNIFNRADLYFLALEWYAQNFDLRQTFSPKCGPPRSN